MGTKGARPVGVIRRRWSAPRSTAATQAVLAAKPLASSMADRNRSAQASRPYRACASRHESMAPGTVTVHGPRNGISSRPAACAASMEAVRAERPLPLRRDGAFGGRVPDDPEGVTAESARVAGDDRQRGVGGDGGIHGTAAGPEDGQTGGAGEVMGRCHGPVGATRQRRGHERRFALGHPFGGLLPGRQPDGASSKPSKLKAGDTVQPTSVQSPSERARLPGAHRHHDLGALAGAEVEAEVR